MQVSIGIEAWGTRLQAGPVPVVVEVTVKGRAAPEATICHRISIAIGGTAIFACGRSIVCKVAFGTVLDTSPGSGISEVRPPAVLHAI